MEPSKNINDQPESRGTLASVFFCRFDQPERRSSASFSKPNKWYTRSYIQVPIGWAFSHDHIEGVVLVNTFGKRLTALEAHRLAFERKEGFSMSSFYEQAIAT